MSDACGESSLSTFNVVDHFNREDWRSNWFNLRAVSNRHN
jgi:hypothetical protein